jgi:hypothetical protein
MGIESLNAAAEAAGYAMASVDEHWDEVGIDRPVPEVSEASPTGQVGEPARAPQKLGAKVSGLIGTLRARAAL